MGDADLSESCVAGGRRSVSTVQPAPRYLRPNWPMVWPAPQRAFRILVPVTDSEGTQQSPRSIGTSPTRTESPGC
jgi:hypothetical protein